MPNAAEKPLPIIETFDEKEFYLDEFRGHTLLFSVPLEELAHDEDYERLAGIVHELLVNDTRVLMLVRVPDSGRGEQVLRRLQRRLGPLIFSDETIPLFAHRRPRAEAFLQLAADAFTAPESAAALLTTIWSVLRRGPLFVGVIAGVNHAEATFFAQEIAVRLRVHKLILIEPEGGVTGADGKQLSFMDEQLLATLQSAGRSGVGRPRRPARHLRRRARRRCSAAWARSTCARWPARRASSSPTKARVRCSPERITAVSSASASTISKRWSGSSSAASAKGS